MTYASVSAALPSPWCIYLGRSEICRRSRHDRCTLHISSAPSPVARVAVQPCSHAATYSLGHFAFAPLCVNTLSHFLDLFLYLRCGLAVVVAVAVVRGVGGDEKRCDRDAECGCDEGGGGCKCVVPRVGHRGGGVKRVRRTGEMTEAGY